MDPSKILCLSFSNKSVKDLSRRLKLQGIPISAYEETDKVRVSTFHSFGKSFLKEDFNWGKLNYTFQNFIRNRILDDFHTYEDFRRIFYIAFNHKPSLPPYDPSDIGEKRKFSDNHDGRIGAFLKGSIVNSVEDFEIANFLALHNIEYVYMKEYYSLYKNEKNLKFDFYLPEYDIYIEDIRYNEKNNPDWLKSQEKRALYIDQINFKLSLFNYELDDVVDDKIPILKDNYGSKLILVNSYLMDDRDYLDDLKDKLINCGVQLNKMSDEELIDYLYHIQFFEDLWKVTFFFNNFVESAKEKKLTSEDLRSFEGKNKSENLFLPIVCDYFDFYVDYLEENNLMDFADMVIKATPLIKNIDYDYVLVDEYQDISGARFELLEKILEETGAKLVVVGDDWQSIYGFTGCEVKYFSNFEDYFEDFTEIYLDDTYRASNQLITAAGNFIDDDYLISKNLQSEKSLKKPIELRLYSGKDKREKELNEDLLVYEIIEELSKENYAEVMILSRYNDHLESLKEKLDDLYIDLRFDIDVKYNTFHTAKGLEAENVIILDVNLINGGKGIPSKVTTNGFMRFVSFNNDEEKQYEEERRLFYVALTRTKNKVFLCAEEGKESPFIDELDGNAVTVKTFEPSLGFNPFYTNRKILAENWENRELIGESGLKCPKCKTGHLNLYSINGLKYVACSRFEECKLFIDEKIVSDSVIDTIEKCQNCKNGIIFTNHEGNRVCSYKRCKSNKNKPKKKKVKIKSGLFDDEFDLDLDSDDSSKKRNDNGKIITTEENEINKDSKLDNKSKSVSDERKKEFLQHQKIYESEKAKIENERLEKERLLQLEKERLEEEFKEKERLLQLEKERLEEEFKEKERLLQLEKEKLQKNSKKEGNKQEDLYLNEKNKLNAAYSKRRKISNKKVKFDRLKRERKEQTRLINNKTIKKESKIKDKNKKIDKDKYIAKLRTRNKQLGALDNKK